uniref:hypothetical protein n=1 Tax=uncultured Erythrobacter sp. TaxID=263913 RepID=UPI002639ECC1|nr:hypothetical protein [uncultured Erythrobacter sp.]
MNWAAVSAASDILAAIAVVASLCFVAVQLRQNTKAIVANSRQGLLDADLGLISGFIDHALDPHLIGDCDELSPENERRLTWMVVKALRVREFAWHQYRSGILDEQTWQSYMEPIPGIFSSERARSVLEFYTGNKDFLNEVRARIVADLK